MAYPMLKALSVGRRDVSQFRGYFHSLGCGAGQFYDERNLSARDYPALSLRKQRGIAAAPGNFQGMIAKDSLCYVDGSKLVINGYPVELGLSTAEAACPKTLVSMGAYLLIFPDKIYFNTADFTDFGPLEAENTVQTLSLTLCTLDGAGQNPRFRGAAAPENMENGDLWLDEGTVPHTMRVYCDATGTWDAMETTYVKLSAPGIGAGISQYDGITLRGAEGTLYTAGGEVPEDLSRQIRDIFGTAVVWDRGEDYLILTGILDADITLQGNFTAERKLPYMDFVLECGNRIWGCRYGRNREGKIVNELYASKLGDFKNFFCYMGTAADSFTVSLGTDGQFTGTISYLGNPLFFKEDVLHRVYGTAPGNFTVQSTACRGVEKGSSESLTILGEKLYYKSPTGICVYDGSLPSGISQALGDAVYHGAVGGGLGSLYYVSLLDARENSHLFVLDTEKGIWHKEDSFRPSCFCTCREELYAASGNRIYTMGGTGETAGEEIPWMAETGALGLHTPDRKYVIRLTLRLQMAQGAEMTLWGKYDEGNWEKLAELRGDRKRIITLPIRPKRCDTLRLRAEGVGETKLLSAHVTETKGSDWDG